MAKTTKATKATKAQTATSKAQTAPPTLHTQPTPPPAPTPVTVPNNMLVTKTAGGQVANRIVLAVCCTQKGLTHGLTANQIALLIGKLTPAGKPAAIGATCKQVSGCPAHLNTPGNAPYTVKYLAPFTYGGSTAVFYKPTAAGLAHAAAYVAGNAKGLGKQRGGNRVNVNFAGGATAHQW